MYKGRKLGTFGDVAAMSLMTGKSLAIGEAGMLVTDDRHLYERAVGFGHYERFGDAIESPDLKPFVGLPLGGHKYRMHQMSAAVGRVQLRHYDARIAEIQTGDEPVLGPSRGNARPRAAPAPEGLGQHHGGLVRRPRALRPRGARRPVRLALLRGRAGRGRAAMAYPGRNRPLHLHPLFNTCDVYGHGKPTRIAHADRDLRQAPGSLPVTEARRAAWSGSRGSSTARPDLIDEYAAAYRKAALGFRDLLAGDQGDPPDVGGWHFFAHRPLRESTPPA